MGLLDVTQQMHQFRGIIEGLITQVMRQGWLRYQHCMSTIIFIVLILHPVWKTGIGLVDVPGAMDDSST